MTVTQTIPTIEVLSRPRAARRPRLQGEQPGVSDLAIAICTKNNIRTIDRVLRSVETIAAHIVVIDSGSTDGTIELCEQFGATVIHRSWEGMTRQRKFAIDQCTDHTWVLVLDSDESLEPELRDSIRCVVELDDPKFLGWAFNRKVWFAGGWLNYTFQPEWRVRLIRPGAADVVGIGPEGRGGHDRIEVNGRIGRLKGVCRHDSWADINDMTQRHVVMAQRAAKYAGEGGRFWNIIINPSAAFFKQLIIKRGFLDGWRGFVCAAGAASATLLKHVYIAQARALPAGVPNHPQGIMLSEHLHSCFSDDRAFDQIMRLQGEVFRYHKNRRTIRVELDGRAYFVKIHHPTSWIEIVKNVLSFRLPVLTANPEMRGITRLQQLGVKTMTVAGFGSRGKLPNHRESFLITEELSEMTDLNELVSDWGGTTGMQQINLKRTLIHEVATIARTLHNNGLNHRDFYLYHFLTKRRDWTKWTIHDPVILHLIDLHRMQIRRQTPQRWIIKDLAGLLFASMDVKLSRTDLLRFFKGYWGSSWRDRLRYEPRFTRKVIKRALRLYQSEHGKPAELAAMLESFS